MISESTYIIEMITKHVASRKKFEAEKGVRVVYFFDKSKPYGGVTVAYHPIFMNNDGRPKGVFAEVAVAYCHPKEAFSRKVGREIAVDALYNGISIKLPIYAGDHPVRALREMFYEYQTYIRLKNTKLTNTL